MGIYLGQLPPAEIARLKAELAETLIANFCYPRFFDHRAESLRMRPVDRSKRQEVWLYLSSVDFTAWNRIDLLSPDFQHQIERLFIQFVQRNRSFFGNQGRRRMPDVRMLISTCAASVSQGLRHHLTGQKPQGGHAFGSPRSVVSWNAPNGNARSELSWEQIAPTTMQLQQQLQELRGETRPAAVEERFANGANGASSANSVAARRPVSRPSAPAAGISAPPAGNGERGGVVAEQITMATPQVRPRPATGAPGVPPATRSAPAASAAASPVAAPAAPATPVRKMEVPAQPVEAPAVARKPEPVGQTVDVRRSGALGQDTRRSGPLSQETPTAAVASVSAPTASPARPATRKSPTSPLAEAAPPAPVAARPLPPPLSASSSLTTTGQREMLTVGEDDLAIFEQMRHQLLVWLRVEAVSAGLEISGLGPAQLLELLRQQAHFDETRLQVVSTLLNLSNQVIKTGLVSTLDYKQALMFHLMHTRR